MSEGDPFETLVVYSPHRPRAAVVADLMQLGFPPGVTICACLDDLLTLLEVDGLDVIVFDTGVSRHERSYVTRWAHIFKPAVETHEGLASLSRFQHGIFFDSAILTDAVNSA